MASKPTSKQEEALQFLDDLDSFAPPPPPSVSGIPDSSAPPPPHGEAAEVLAFLDEITQKSSEAPKTTASILAEAEASRPPSTPPLVVAARKSSDSPYDSPATTRVKAPTAPLYSKAADTPASSVSGWGLGSIWSSASAALHQARTVADEQVKQLQNVEQARKLGEGVMSYVKQANLDKIGQELKAAGYSTFTEILNAVAPPINEHEVIQVWLSHDMHGYEGVEGLVYRALTKVMEQVEGGDLVVNKGNESRPKDTTIYEGARNLHTVEGYDQALKLASANLEEIIKLHSDTAPAAKAVTQHNPTTYSSVFLRIQPYFSTLPLQSSAADAQTPSSDKPFGSEQRQLQFLLHLSDPSHTLLHTQVTQAVPAEWLHIWDESEWVEDLVVEAIRLGVEVVGQQYVVARMGWMRKAEKETPSKASQVTEQA